MTTKAIQNDKNAFNIYFYCTKIHNFKISKIIGKLKILF